jgi:hypothetical protein
MHNITLRHIHVTTVATEKQEILHIIMSVCLYSCLSYLACKLQLFHIVLFASYGLFGSTVIYHNFPHRLINGTTFGKKLLNIIHVF